MSRPSVLVVSKPVTPPWNDSSKNLVRDLVLGTDEARFFVLTDGVHCFERDHIVERPIYRKAGGFAPSLAQNARVAGLLLADRRAEIHHFFFAPNPRTSAVIRGIRRLRRRPAVHTICSVPGDFGTVRRTLFADVHVAVSAYTAERLQAQGVRDVRVIPPSIAPMAPVFDSAVRRRLRRELGLPEDGSIVVFPGDYEFSRAADMVASAARRLEGGRRTITWVFACRLKTSAARAIEARIKSELAPLARRGEAVFFNHVPRIHDLLSASDLVVLPAESTYAKMDLPIVLIEALALGRPIVVTNRPPLNELPIAEAGFAVEPESPGELADAIDGALSDPTTLVQKARAGARIAAERFARERVAAEYAALYRGLS